MILEEEPEAELPDYEESFILNWVDDESSYDRTVDSMLNVLGDKRPLKKNYLNKFQKDMLIKC